MLHVKCESEFLRKLCEQLEGCTEYDILPHVNEDAHEPVKRSGSAVAVCTCTIHHFYEEIVNRPLFSLSEPLLLYLVLVNPNTATFWNCRRRAVLASKISTENELWLTQLILKTHPRSNEALLYRQWIIKMFHPKNKHILQNELTFCSSVADDYRAHYAIWQYRRFLLELLGTEHITADLSHVESWLHSHPMDSSGWSYVGWLLQQLKNAVTQFGTTQWNIDRPTLKQMLFDRLRTVSQSIELYPERECLWMFKRILFCLLRDMENISYIPHLTCDQTDVALLNVVNRVYKLIANNSQTRPFFSVASFLSWCHAYNLCPALSELPWSEVLRWRHILFLVRHSPLHSGCPVSSNDVQTFHN